MPDLSIIKTLLEKSTLFTPEKRAELLSVLDRFDEPSLIYLSNLLTFEQTITQNSQELQNSYQEVLAQVHNQLINDYKEGEKETIHLIEKKQAEEDIQSAESLINNLE